jgi:hypothetical protein
VKREEEEGKSLIWREGEEEEGDTFFMEATELTAAEASERFRRP